MSDDDLSYEKTHRAKSDECCEKWDAGSREINGAIEFRWLHGREFDVRYRFEFCPWCGASRKNQ